MSDTNLDPSIISVTNRAVAVASTANPRELLNISRIGPSLEQSENANLEITLNARALDLAPTATANELRSLGMAIGNMLEPQTERIFMDWREGFLPDQRFADGQFLRTSGSHQKSWGGVATTTLDELELVSVATGESLVYNGVSGKFENSTKTFAITVYATEADLPASPLTGSLGYVTEASEVYYFDGSLWTIVQDVFSGIYRGNWQTNVLNNFANRHYPFANSGTIIKVDGTAATGGTIAGGDVDTTSRWASSVQNNFENRHYPFANSGTIMMVDGTAATGGTIAGGDVDTTSRWAASHAGNSILNNFGNNHSPFANSGTVMMVDGTEATGGTTAGGSVDTTNRWSSGNSRVYNLYYGHGTPSWNTSSTVLEISGTDVTTGTGDASNVNYIFSGVRQDDVNGENSGSVYVYDVANITATPTILTPPGGQAGDQFGLTISRQNKGNKIAVGGLFDNQTGGLYVYDTTDLSVAPTRAATPTSAIGIQKRIAGALGSLVMSDNYIITSSNQWGQPGELYFWDINDVTAQPTVIPNPDANTTMFGYANAVVGNSLVTAPYNGIAGNPTKLYVYDLTDLNAAPVDITPAGVDDNTRLGSAMNVSGGYLLVGHEQGHGWGRILVYDASDLTAAPTTIDNPENLGIIGRPTDGFGVSTNGKLIIGNTTADSVGGVASGGRFYVYDVTNLSAAPTIMSVPDAEQSDYSGKVFVDGTTLVVASPYDDENGENSGSMYVYDTTDLSAAPTKITPSEGSATDYFSQSVGFASVSVATNVVGGSIDTTNRWTNGSDKVYNLYYGHGVPSWNTSSTVIDE